MGPDAVLINQLSTGKIVLLTEYFISRFVTLYDTQHYYNNYYNNVIIIFKMWILKKILRMVFSVDSSLSMVRVLIMLYCCVHQSAAAQHITLPIMMSSLYSVQ